MQFIDQPTHAACEAVRSLNPRPFWLDDPLRPDPFPRVDHPLDCDLLVIGGGFSGLWSALLAKEQDPSRSVVLVEAGRIAEGATGRNGGFVSHSLTHGLGNGISRWPGEIGTLVRLGYRNLDELGKAIAEQGIDCGFRRAGDLTVAVAEHQVQDLIQGARAAGDLGVPLGLLDSEQIQGAVHSRGGAGQPGSTCLGAGSRQRRGRGRRP
jgi:glycine/D-amino acid oxidase-like deaminating enzyme